MAFSLDHSGYGRIELLVSEVRHVNGKFIDHCCGVAFTGWWRLGIFSLAPLAPAGPRPGPSACGCRYGMGWCALAQDCRLQRRRGERPARRVPGHKTPPDSTLSR